MLHSKVLVVRIKGLLSVSDKFSSYSFIFLVCLFLKQGFYMTAFLYHHIIPALHETEDFAIF